MEQLLLPDICFSLVCKTGGMWQEGTGQSYLPKLKHVFLPTLSVLTSTYDSLGGVIKDVNYNNSSNYDECLKINGILC